MRTCAAAHDTGWPKLVALHPCPYDAARRVALVRSVELLALLALQAGGWGVQVVMAVVQQMHSRWKGW